jgi:hypothetical protein
MSDLRTNPKVRMLRWILYLLILAPLAFSTWSRSYPRGISQRILVLYDLLLQITVIAIAVLAIAVLFRAIFSRHPRIRRFLKWSALLATLILMLATWISREWPVRWETGYPGNGMCVRLSWGELDLEIDHSHETRHAVLCLGAPGYYRTQLPFSSVLLPLTPLTFLLWTENLYRRFPWLIRRYPEGHCQTCGYNLTGNTSGICPECGKPIVEEGQDEERV